MKIITYNVNGLRAALRKGFLEWIVAVDADVLCLQEVKALPSELPLVEFKRLGYQYYCTTAQRKGYSGVAILSRLPIKKLSIGCGIPAYDAEGRVLRVDLESLSVMSVYMPSGTSGQVRQDFKMHFLADFMVYISKLRLSTPHLVISGDFNICHKSIDIHDPIRNKNSSGFLPEERAWMDVLLTSGFIDTFRHLCSEPHQYTWWSYRANARNRNLGWRIDYHIATTSLQERIRKNQPLVHARHSDHCPVLLEL